MARLVFPALLMLSASPLMGSTVSVMPEALVRKFKSFDQCLKFLEATRLAKAKQDYQRNPDWSSAKVDGGFQQTGEIGRPSSTEAVLGIVSGIDRADRGEDGILRGVSSRSSSQSTCRGKRLYVSTNGSNFEIFRKGN
jgi:hypothetical protein